MNETVSLKLEADASGWEKAFTSATADAAKLGKEVDETRAAFEGMGKSMTTRMSSLGGQLTKATTAVDLFGTKATAAVKSTWAQVVNLNAALEISGKVMDWGKKAIEVAKFSAEFRRMEAAVPVARMRELEAATRGTVSKFDLLKEATKGMDIPISDAVLKIERTQAAWSNLVDSVKLGLGDIVNELGHAAGRLLGIVEATRAERLNAGSRGYALKTGSFTGSETNEYLAPFRGKGFGLIDIAAIAGGNITGDATIAQRSLSFQARRAQALAATARQLQIEDASAGTVGAAIFAQKFGQGVAGVNKGKGTRQRGQAPRPDQGFFWNFSSANPNAYQNQPWGARTAGALQDMGGDALNDYRNEDSLFSGFGAAAGGIGNLAGGAARGVQGGLDAHAAAAKAKAQELEDLQAKFADTSQATGAAYQTVMTGMAAGLSAALDAAISGSEGFAKAAARASAGALKAVAMESGVKALFATAEGIFGLNPKGFAAAGVYAATAAAAGVAAAALGAAAGPMPSASTGGGARSAPGGGFAPNRSMGGGGGVTETHYHINGNISAATHRELGATLEKSRNKALTSSKVRNESARTVKVE